MGTSNNKDARPYGVISLDRIDFNGLYKVSSKEGNDIPGLLGFWSRNPFCGSIEYLLLMFDFQSRKEGIEFKLCTTNQDATAKFTGEFYCESDVRKRTLCITSFCLSQKYKAYGTYGNFAILIEASKDLKRLILRFYEDTSGFASHLFDMWKYDCLGGSVA